MLIKKKTFFFFGKSKITSYVSSPFSKIPSVGHNKNQLEFPEQGFLNQSEPTLYKERGVQSNAMTGNHIKALSCYSWK